MPEPNRIRAKRLPAEERRLQILDIAIGVFAQLGYYGASTADIAAAAEIGEPTIYRYFDSKRDLYLEAIKHVGEEITENWRQIVNSSEDAAEALQRIGRWYYEELRRRPRHLVLRFKALTESTDSDVTTLVREGYLRNKRLVQELYEQAQTQGSRRLDVDAHTLAWLFMAIGSILDVTHLLGLQDEFGTRGLESLAQFFEKATETQGTAL